MDKKRLISSYEIPAEELLDRFMRATAQAGVSNSGLVIDVAAGFDHANMRYFRGVVLARMEGKTPPYKSGGKVRVKADGEAREVSYRGPELVAKSVWTIERVWYRKSVWALELKGVAGEVVSPLYPASSFEEAKETADA